MNFPLIEAIHGRRSRRFAKGASIPDGPLAFTSRHDPAPISDLEQMILLTTVARQHRLAQPLRVQPELCAEDPELPGRGGRPDVPLVGRLPHQRDLLHRRQRHLLPADARHASGGQRPGDRPQGLAGGAPVADRQALGRAAQHPAAGGAHGDAQHLVLERAGQHAGDPGRRRRPAHGADARLSGAERRLHLRRHQQPADPGHGPFRRPGRHRGALSAELRRAVRADRDDRRDRDILLCRRADAAGARPRRLDVRRAERLQRARRKRRPGGARASASSRS